MASDQQAGCQFPTARIKGRHPHFLVVGGLVVGGLVVGGLVVGCDVVGCDVVGCDVICCEAVRAGAMIQPWSKIPRLSGCGFLSSFDSAIPYKTLEFIEFLIISSTSFLVE